MNYVIVYKWLRYLYKRMILYVFIRKIYFMTGVIFLFETIEISQYYIFKVSDSCLMSFGLIQTPWCPQKAASTDRVLIKGESSLVSARSLGGGTDACRPGLTDSSASRVHIKQNRRSASFSNFLEISRHEVP